jgi:hypothetical protein
VIVADDNKLFRLHVEFQGNGCSSALRHIGLELAPWFTIECDRDTHRHQHDLPPVFLLLLQKRPNGLNVLFNS